jgi:hypothetical protein
MRTIVGMGLSDVDNQIHDVRAPAAMRAHFAEVLEPV